MAKMGCKRFDDFLGLELELGPSVGRGRGRTILESLKAFEIDLTNLDRRTHLKKIFRIYELFKRWIQVEKKIFANL